jgi:hypothetical protein
VEEEKKRGEKENALAKKIHQDMSCTSSPGREKMWLLLQ